MTEQEYQKSMFNLIDQYYEAYNTEGEDYAKPVLDQYAALADEALKAYPTSPCYMIDPMQWEFFSDYYKAVNGFRPRGEWTVQEVNDWWKQPHELDD